MARYRLYKNGIYGHRHKDLYIVPGKDGGDFRVFTESGELFMKDLHDYDDCEWCIDLLRCDKKMRDSLERAYALDIGKLNKAIAVLIAKKTERGFLSDPQESALTLFQAMKRRKAKNREFWPQATVLLRPGEILLTFEDNEKKAEGEAGQYE